MRNLNDTTEKKTFKLFKRFDFISHFGYKINHNRLYIVRETTNVTESHLRRLKKKPIPFAFSSNYFPLNIFNRIIVDLTALTENKKGKIKKQILG